MKFRILPGHTTFESMNITCTNYEKVKTKKAAPPVLLPVPFHAHGEEILTLSLLIPHQTRNYSDTFD